MMLIGSSQNGSSGRFSGSPPLSKTSSQFDLRDTGASFARLRGAALPRLGECSFTLGRLEGADGALALESASATPDLNVRR